ncbi:cell division protein FtsQ/DivIB [Clostridium sardiniense]|uniref:cell division protein FtsQ/DivIB n=1 Tax=Clostridium sardiniense TaxID=29369 RepID=UPI001959A375|nr:FtsQ-type POTRA domain-containing protein [Clostridium sardiniense]
MKNHCNSVIILMDINKIVRIGLEKRMGANGNKYIKKAKRKRLIKKSIFIIILLSIAGGLIVTKSNLFLIKNVKISGENLVTKDLIDEKLQSIKGENIFFIKSSEVEKVLKSDPYVNGVTLKRHFPSTLEVDIKEKNIGYYVKYGDEYDVISSDLVLLEKVNKLKGDGLIEIKGLKSEGRKIGEKYVDTKDDKRLENFLETLYEIKNSNTTKNKITMVNVTNINDIIVYFNNDVKVKVGNGNDLIKKINTALNILEDKKLNLKKGYIDLSFEGTPVIKEEK